jgi:hypothetical protein
MYAVWNSSVTVKKKKRSPDIDRAPSFQTPDYEIVDSGFPSVFTSVYLYVCKYACACMCESLAPERLNGFHSYSLFKSPAILDRRPVNLNIQASDLGVPKMGPETQKKGDFL